MKVLVACEFSGIVRDAFIARGHDAISCDLLPTERPGPHFQGPVDVYLSKPHVGLFDLVIAHPPCTYLTKAGQRWLYEGGRRPTIDQARWQNMNDAAHFFRWFLGLNAEHVAVENPEMHKYGLAIVGRKPDQMIQPWGFGHGEKKGTGWWLKNLPPLMPTNIVSGREARVHRAAPGPNRWKERSRTLQGIADAMADQWGSVKAIEVAA